MTPMTKWAPAHLPLAFLDQALLQTRWSCVLARAQPTVPCFRGTSKPPPWSWYPAFPTCSAYFHSDGTELLRSPLSHVVIDDGRRYLERTAEHYDVITLDPPPPVPAAGTSLLYSTEFYAIINRRLAPGGILQQWLPRGGQGGPGRSRWCAGGTFPYVRVFHALDGEGFHFLASESGFLLRTPRELAQRLPARAAQDLVEWGPKTEPQAQFAIILNRELALDQMTSGLPRPRAPGQPPGKRILPVAPQSAGTLDIPRLAVPH